MSRRNNQDPQILFKRTNQDLERHSDSPSIAPIIKRLLEDSRFLADAIRSGSEPEVASSIENILNKFATITDLLTKKETPRYFFDSVMLGTIKREWSAAPSKATFSANIYPSYLADAWGHKICPLPVKAPGPDVGNFVSFIFFPGNDDLESVELDDYAFVLHEIGHELQHHHKDFFKTGFQSDLERVLHQENLAGLADKGALKSKTQELMDDLQRKWTPTNNHEDWSSEMMNDLIALWSGGPAYLYSFENHLNSNQHDPFELVQTHPPLALRVEAMIKAGEILGWNSEISSLRKLLKKWHSSRWSKNANNRFYALRNEKILQSCIDNTLSACKELQLPFCDKERIKRVEQELQAADIPELGIDIIIAAWIVKQQKDDSAFLVWERQTVSQINGLISRRLEVPEQRL